MVLVITSFFANNIFSQNKIKSYKIFPVDESKKDSSLSRFLNNLKTICINKDTTSLYILLDSGIVTSWGGGQEGKEAFTRHWKLSKPDSSELWQTMLKIIKLGGVFDKDDEGMFFNMPYANSNIFFNKVVSEVMPYWIYICLVNREPVYNKPNTNSLIVGYLSYDIVYYNDKKTSIQNLPKESKFMFIETVNKKIKGWVQYDNFYCDAGLKLIIRKKKNQWKIVGLFPFD